MSTTILTQHVQLVKRKKVRTLNKDTGFPSGLPVILAAQKPYGLFPDPASLLIIVDITESVASASSRESSSRQYEPTLVTAGTADQIGPYANQAATTRQMSQALPSNAPVPNKYGTYNFVVGAMP